MQHLLNANDSIFWHRGSSWLFNSYTACVSAPISIVCHGPAAQQQLSTYSLSSITATCGTTSAQPASQLHMFLNFIGLFSSQPFTSSAAQGPGTGGNATSGTVLLPTQPHALAQVAESHRRVNICHWRHAPGETVLLMLSHHMPGVSSVDSIVHGIFCCCHSITRLTCSGVDRIVSMNTECAWLPHTADRYLHCNRLHF